MNKLFAFFVAFLSLFAVTAADAQRAAPPQPTSYIGFVATRGRMPEGTFGGGAQSTFGAAPAVDADLAVAVPAGDSLTAVGFSPNSQFVASSSWDSKVYVWELSRNVTGAPQSAAVPHGCFAQPVAAGANLATLRPARRPTRRRALHRNASTAISAPRKPPCPSCA